MTSEEKENLDRISMNSLYAVGMVPVLAMQYCFRILLRHVRRGNLLEMGPAEGVMTELLATTGNAITLVDGSSSFCDNLRQRFPQMKVVEALFEEFEAEDRFDTIVLGHVLEHVQDPAEILARARRWLKPGGRIFGAVPNARSLHRQAAVVMGLLRQEDELNDLDRHHGHRRVFNPESFRNAFYQAGLKIEAFGGYWIKPISNAQIEQQWTPEMLEAFMQLGERYPDIAAEIYVVAYAP
jgi:2-polyprenyl-3-methyl-5-hydroxy-6-metoxy-1,4-benzoquinol methylase